MQNFLETTENSQLPKKTWVIPSYEIISKDIVKSSLNPSPGPESTSPLLQNS